MLLLHALGVGLSSASCSSNYAFYVNRVAATCSVPGALPLNMSRSYLDVDLGRFLVASERVSLVQIPACSETQTSACLSAGNSQAARHNASGWMRVVNASGNRLLATSETVMSVNQSDVASAIGALQVGCYAVCWRNSTGAWSDVGIRVSVQSFLPGLEYNGISNANGLRTAIVRWADKPIAGLPLRANITLRIR